MEYKTNFFTCCNGSYIEFAPLFALSSLFHNDDIVVEIGLDSDESIEKIKNQLVFIENNYSNRLFYRSVPFSRYNSVGNKIRIAPNTIRFIETPSVKTEYVYISDIDIICLEKQITSIHVNHMEKYNLDFSNIVREKLDKNLNKKKLTGLHFTKWENYYPIKHLEEFEDILSIDEVFLFEILSKRGLRINNSNTFRPVHGIHASPNRNPSDKNLNWHIDKWKMEWLNFRNSNIFIEIESKFSDNIKNIIKIIDEK